MSPVLERKIINGFAGHFSEDELDIIAELMGRIQTLPDPRRGPGFVPNSVRLALYMP